MGRYILFVAILFSMNSCKSLEFFSVDKNQKKTHLWVERDTSEYKILKYKKGYLSGKCIYLNNDGLTVGYFKKGKKNGIWKYYFENHLYQIDKYQKDSLVYTRKFNLSNVW